MPEPESPSDQFAASIDVDADDLAGLVGEADAVLRRLEARVPTVEIRISDGAIGVSGPETAARRAESAIRALIDLEHADPVTPQDVDRVLAVLDHSDLTPSSVLRDAIVSHKGKGVRPKTVGQRRYVDAMDENTIVFGIGPAGTGKTYLAVAKAVSALQSKQVKHIILTRPAVEAGERLGFLPGTLSDKIDPYLQPLFFALSDMMEPEVATRLIETGVIEVAPLAYMRGRTFNDSFVILDEAQNTSPEQMKMFLTRLGEGSTMVVTGDITQVDLPRGASGLQVVTEVLADLDDIGFVRLTSDDVVRHSLVVRIVDAYTKYEATQLAASFANRSQRERSNDRQPGIERPEAEEP